MKGPFEQPETGLLFFTTDGGDPDTILQCRKTYGLDARRPKGIVIDIGAHHGGFACVAAQTARKVFAFEPDKENFEVLLANVDMNGLANILPINLAAGDGKPIVIRRNTANSGGHGLILKTGTKVSWPTANLREIVSGLAAPVELLKCDCEGGEYDLFRSAAIEDIRRIAEIIMEVHEVPHGRHPDLVRYLEGIGMFAREYKSQAASAKLVNLFWK